MHNAGNLPCVEKKVTREYGDNIAVFQHMVAKSQIIRHAPLPRMQLYLMSMKFTRHCEHIWLNTTRPKLQCRRPLQRMICWWYVIHWLFPPTRHCELFSFHVMDQLYPAVADPM